MAVRNLGRVVRKSRPLSEVLKTLPASEGFRADGTSTGFFGGGAIVTSSYEEDIVYTTKPRSQRHLANACIHKRLIYSYGDPSLNWVRVSNLAPGFEGWWTKYYQGHAHATGAHSVALGYANAVLPGTSSGANILGNQGQALILSGWERVKPNLTKVSLPNFLIDIGQLRTLTSWWSGKSLRRTLRDKDLKHTGKQLSSGVLKYSYGVIPGYQDLAASIKAIRTLSKSLSDFIKMAGTKQHKVATVYSDVASESGTFDYGADSHQPCTWNAARSVRVTAHFAFEPRPIGALNSIDGFLRGIMDSLGFELNPAILWDAVPLSFLVDNFISITNFLNRFKVDALELPVLLEDSYLQVKEDYHVGSHLRLDVNSSVSSPSLWPGAATIQRRFWRQPILPDYAGMRALDVHWPTSRQALLGFALAVNRSGKIQRVTKADFFKPGQQLIMTPISQLTDYAR